MKLAPMSYHYVRYPITKFLDKVERSPFDQIDLYCSAPQMNIFDYPLARLMELEHEIRRRGDSDSGNNELPSEDNYRYPRRDHLIRCKANQRGRNK